MDYSGVDEGVKEDIAERVAMAVTTLENLAQYLAASGSGREAVDDLLGVRRDLVNLVKDLGGHPAIP